MRNLAKIRKETGMNQTQLANAVGATQTTVSFWELGKTSPSVETLDAICQVLSCTPNDILGFTADAPSPADADLLDKLRRLDAPAREAVLRVVDAFLLVGGGGGRLAGWAFAREMQVLGAPFARNSQLLQIKRTERGFWPLFEERMDAVPHG